MDLAAISLMPLLVLALCCPRPACADHAGTQAGAPAAQTAPKADPKAVAKEALQGFWAGRQAGGTLVCAFSGSIMLSSSPDGWD